MKKEDAIIVCRDRRGEKVLYGIVPNDDKNPLDPYALKIRARMNAGQVDYFVINNMVEFFGVTPENILEGIEHNPKILEDNRFSYKL